MACAVPCQLALALAPVSCLCSSNTGSSGLANGECQCFLEGWCSRTCNSNIRPRHSLEFAAACTGRRAATSARARARATKDRATATQTGSLAPGTKAATGNNPATTDPASTGAAGPHHDRRNAAISAARVSATAIPAKSHAATAVSAAALPTAAIQTSVAF